TPVCRLAAVARQGVGIAGRHGAAGGGCRVVAGRRGRAGAAAAGPQLGRTRGGAGVDPACGTGATMKPGLSALALLAMIAPAPTHAEILSDAEATFLDQLVTAAAVLGGGR